MVRQALKDARNRAGISQADLATAVGIGRDHYGRVERGEESPSDALAERLAGAVDLEPWEIKSDYTGLTDREFRVLQGLRQLQNREKRAEAFRIILAMLDEWSRSSAA